MTWREEQSTQKYTAVQAEKNREREDDKKKYYVHACEEVTSKWSAINYTHMQENDSYGW